MALVFTIKPGLDVRLEHPDGTRVMIRFRRVQKGPHTRLQAYIDAPRAVVVHRGQEGPRTTPAGPLDTER